MVFKGIQLTTLKNDKRNNAVNHKKMSAQLQHPKEIKSVKMKTNAEKRDCERRRHTAPIVYSYFNKNGFFDAQTINHCMKSMCIKSSSSIHPGATLYIRVKDFHPNGPCTGAGKGLHTAILAEVKWCKENPDRGTFSYDIGVKYYGPIY